MGATQTWKSLTVVEVYTGSKSRDIVTLEMQYY